MATRSNSEEHKRTGSPLPGYEEQRLIQLISTETAHHASPYSRNSHFDSRSRSVDEAQQVFVRKYAPTVEDEDIEEVEASLRALNSKLYSLSSSLTQKNTHFQETLKASRQYVVEEKGVAMAVKSSPDRKMRTETAHYSKLKKYINEVSANSNSYTFKQALKVVRERIEFCEKLTAEIEEKHRKSHEIEKKLEHRLSILDGVLHEEKLKNEYADNLFKQLHDQGAAGAFNSELPSFIVKKTDEGVQAHTSLTSGGPSLTSLIATGEEAAEQAKRGAAAIRYESELQLRSLEERDASIRERESEFSLLQTRFLNKVQKKKRELESFASDLKDRRRMVEEKEQAVKEEEHTITKLTENLKKQERFLKRREKEVEEAQLQMDLIEQNVREKQLIINKQIEKIQTRERNLATDTLEKSFELQQKEETLQKRETELLEREQLSTDMQLRENIIETKLQTISQNEFNLLKDQAALKARLKEAQQREAQLETKKSKFALKLTQLSEAFVQLQQEKSELLQREDALKLREAVLRDKEVKFHQFKHDSISQIKQSSMEQLSEKDSLLKKKSRLEVMEKKLHFTEQLLTQDQTHINVNKRETEIRNKEINLLQKELELEMQQQELATKIDEVNTLVSELAQWSGMPPPLEEFQVHSELNQSSTRDLQLTPNPSGPIPQPSPSSQTDGSHRIIPISLSSSPIAPLKPATNKAGQSNQSMYLMAADNLQLSLEQKSFYSGILKSGTGSQVGTQEISMTPVSKVGGGGGAGGGGGEMLDIDESAVEEGDDKTEQSMDGIREILREMEE